MSVQHHSSLIETLLNFKNPSPLVSIFDTIAQSGIPVLYEFQKRAKNAGFQVVHIETTGSKRKTDIPDVVIRNRVPEDIVSEIKKSFTNDGKKFIITISSYTRILLEDSSILTSFLSRLLKLRRRCFADNVLIFEALSVVLIYHLDVNIARPPYSPPADRELSILSTSIIHTESYIHYQQELFAKSRAEISIIEIERDVEGIVVPKGSNGLKCIVTLEQRRKSGRGVSEKYIFEKSVFQKLKVERIEIPTKEQDWETVTTFNLTLNEEQKKAKESVTLPHFKAQETSSELGVIYYDPDSADDFDEEDPDEDLFL
ncbi:Elongator complex protein 5 [Neolecta irregularis DAH-3]|uniref:Elongator complex protein 5 n=1 Tax=Neolecta irregularis (strain DAH-3) TaxID=1198029 RepID=A0A1U7LHY2_NEOID|nr:Elongator complex protein 5 [Neolecta irregularis DAH-3]|eukprot:OLL22266.1 Elongator complex protein 5 [Neolecta irregularis DAH-3]